MTGRSRHRGFLLVDLTGAIVVFVAAMALFATAMALWQTGRARLEDQRDATRIAERAILDLQTGRTPQLPERSSGSSAPALRLEVDVLDEPAAPAGLTWARLTVFTDDRPLAFTAMIRADAAASFKPLVSAPDDAEPAVK